jgi:type IV secretory pathway ATPase VirB11/archaellum biosynthesis ATPase
MLHCPPSASVNDRADIGRHTAHTYPILDSTLSVGNRGQAHFPTARSVFGSHAIRSMRLTVNTNPTQDPWPLLPLA